MIALVYHGRAMNSAGRAVRFLRPICGDQPRSKPVCSDIRTQTRGRRGAGVGQGRRGAGVGQVALAVRRRVEAGPRGRLGRAAGRRADEGLDFGAGGGCDGMFCQLIFASLSAVTATLVKSFSETTSGYTRRRGTVSKRPMH